MTLRVPYIADESIERDAEALLVQFAHARGVAIGPPIPIEDIVKEVEGKKALGPLSLSRRSVPNTLTRLGVGGSVIDGLADLPTERTMSRWIIRIEQTDKEMPFSLSVIIGKLDRVYLLLSQNCRRILRSGNVND